MYITFVRKLAVGNVSKGQGNRLFEYQLVCFVKKEQLACLYIYIKFISVISDVQDK